MNTMESKGIPSSFTFSYTSVVSGFAAQVPYGRINDIKTVSYTHLTLPTICSV